MTAAHPDPLSSRVAALPPELRALMQLLRVALGTARADDRSPCRVRSREANYQSNR